MSEVIGKSTVDLVLVIEDHALENPINLCVNQCANMLYSSTVGLVIVKEMLFMLILIVSEQMFIAHLSSPLIVEEDLKFDRMCSEWFLQKDLSSHNSIKDGLTTGGFAQ